MLRNPIVWEFPRGTARTVIWDKFWQMCTHVFVMKDIDMFSCFVIAATLLWKDSNALVLEFPLSTRTLTPPPPTLPSKPLTPPKDMKTKTTRFVIYYMYHVFFKNVSFMAKINLGETITIVSILFKRY